MAVWWEQLRSRFWALPALCCAIALGLGLLLPELDERVADDVPFLFTGGPAGARSLLSAITTSMISVTGLVFSITVVVLQLASSQFSPRVLQSFLRSRVTQLTLGVFTATFLYAIVVLRAVRGDADVAPFVPQVAISGAFVLVLASVALFLSYIQHITQSIRVSTIVGNVGTDTRRLIDRSRREAESATRVHDAELTPAAGLVRSARPGILVRIDTDTLVREARRRDGQLVLLLRIGEYAAEGMPLVAVHSRAADRDERDDVDEDRVRAALHLAQERSMEQDVAFGFRQLVDVAERALSPGVNDPTTAVRALDEVHDLLRRLAVAADLPAAKADEDGVARVVLRERRFGDYLDLGLDEILHYGHESLQVRRRVVSLLDDLQAAARPEHAPVIAAKRRRVESLLDE